jgi:hypothetical protein
VIQAFFKSARPCYRAILWHAHQRIGKVSSFSHASSFSYPLFVSFSFYVFFGMWRAILETDIPRVQIRKKFEQS